MDYRSIFGRSWTSVKLGLHLLDISGHFEHLFSILHSIDSRNTLSSIFQLELSASNTVKVDYRLPVTCSDFNPTTVNSLGLDFIDFLPVTLSIVVAEWRSG